MSFTKENITEALRVIPSPQPGQTLVSGDHVAGISLCDTYISIKLQLPANMGHADLEQIAGKVHIVLSDRARYLATRVDSLVVEFINDVGSNTHTTKFGGMAPSSANIPGAPRAVRQTPTPISGHNPIGGLAQPATRAPSPQGAAPALPGVKHVIAVGAGKGGVGKSTVALNLAVGLARRGHAVGLLDGDIYGPSMPTMLGLSSLEAVVHQGRLQPFVAHGIKCMTIGKLVDPDKPLIWRGPMAHGAFKQLTEQTEWGSLDYLIIDLPPGTGDVSLTMAQLIQLSGAVIVCTPQKVAQDDCIRAARMFQQLQIEVLGVVENMSFFVGDDGKIYDIFGRGGAEQMAQKLSLPFLGACPMTMNLRKNSDVGDPSANFESSDPADRLLVKALNEIITNVESQVAIVSAKTAPRKPVLTIS